MIDLIVELFDIEDSWVALDGQGTLATWQVCITLTISKNKVRLEIRVSPKTK